MAKKTTTSAQNQARNTTGQFIKEIRVTRQKFTPVKGVLFKTCIAALPSRAEVNNIS